MTIISVPIIFGAGIVWLALTIVGLWYLAKWHQRRDDEDDSEWEYSVDDFEEESED